MSKRVAGGQTGNVSADQLATASAAAQAATGRQAAGAPVLQVEQKQPFQATLQLDSNAPVTGMGRRFTRGWWQQRTDDLAVVTSEASNPALGIVQLQLQVPTTNQKASGIICKVSMETLTGWDYGITIWESKEHRGDIMLMVGGAREISPKPQAQAATQQVAGQEQAPANAAKPKREFIRDRRLNDATTAQILSYVMTCLRSVQ